ncbi:4-(cytidine 5'-diphospho)-2-C-methyl-D-erythritol kinase [Helicobacter enhydrae]|uniref:4-(cytidine 5'-diphospho)-2-C-methyl-D-erythritol kinase n=1 Tax=Helicobacter enhydrae TaxID=222136 RepID=A0A1B1U4I9_9HELI|nr:4-(cytidine 5'-diphospho)-2-C-methyl-D-erythritol kinase [Helicobacter enhydrae]ANV97632.1 4-(cytidine 5'-diphospho)-2-C-methyl-D-erythritol kinase [Helicobacter enhydrae]
MRIYPKINIFLNVLGANDEGMHRILSRFVLAYGALYDEMEVRWGGDAFEICGEFDCVMQDNLIFKAKEEFAKSFPAYAQEVEGCRIEVCKRIPCGAGLGGGSANAGAFLTHIASYFGIEYLEILQVAQRVGSDVSFFVSGFESANVCGVGGEVGEFVEPIYEYEIFTPPFACATGSVYRAFDTHCGGNRVAKIEWLNLSTSELLHRFVAQELNDLYLPACRIYPQLLEVAQDLGDGWFFSGSGSSFFRMKR